MIIPLYSGVIVEPNELDLKTKSGLIVVQDSKSVNIQTGKVVAVGQGMITPEGKLVPLLVKVGDTVLFERGGNYREIKQSVDGPKLYHFKESDLLGILEE